MGKLYNMKLGQLVRAHFELREKEKDDFWAFVRRAIGGPLLWLVVIGVAVLFLWDFVKTIQLLLHTHGRKGAGTLIGDLIVLATIGMLLWQYRKWKREKRMAKQSS